MQEIKIETLKLKDYHKCSNIWNMKAQPLAEKWRGEIADGNRLVFVYKINGEFIGEGALALNQNGLIYTDSNIENLLFTRFIGKKERMVGNRIKGPKKRTYQNDADFLKALMLCVEQNYDEC